MRAPDHAPHYTTRLERPKAVNDVVPRLEARPEGREAPVTKYIVESLTAEAKIVISATESLKQSLCLCRSD